MKNLDLSGVDSSSEDGRGQTSCLLIFWPTRRGHQSLHGVRRNKPWYDSLPTSLFSLSSSAVSSRRSTGSVLADLPVDNTPPATLPVLLPRLPQSPPPSWLWLWRFFFFFDRRHDRNDVALFITRAGPVLAWRLSSDSHHVCVRRVKTVPLKNELLTNSLSKVAHAAGSVSPL